MVFKRALFSLLAVQLLGLGFTLWASSLVALGLNPESLQTLDWLAPLLALWGVAFWLGRGGSWKSGLVVALPNIGLWLVMHGGVASRFLPEFWGDGLGGLSWSHAFWWLLALGTALVGAWCGSKLRAKGAPLTLVPLALLVVFTAQLLTPRDPSALYEADGTSVRVRAFDLRQVNFGVYDADFDDAQPFDNRNATWLSQAMPRVWDKIFQRSGGEPLCVVNGGFFGATGPLIGQHEAPVRQSGRSFYDASTLEDDWPDQNATLVWKRENGLTKPQILRDVSFAQLNRAQGALGGVRLLILNGKSETLKPGMGGTTLKCSRTSVAWNSKTNRFWILSVRDPDGEASSVRGHKREKRGERGVQVGGWDVRQVQNFWRQKGATDAVLFDGGESSQITWRDAGGRWRWVHSSYHGSRTPGFLGKKPLRAVLPMLPPTLATGGVLNWFYVSRG